MSCWMEGECLGRTSYSSWSGFTVSYTYTCPTRVGTSTWTQEHKQESKQESHKIYTDQTQHTHIKFVFMLWFNHVFFD